MDSKVKKGEHPSVNEIAIALQLSHSMTWRILRKNLGYKPFKPKTVAPPTEKHQRDRVQFCNWLLEQPSNFPSRCIWSDEKWFHLSQAPNKQNERYWAPFDPEIEEECCIQGGDKIMAWAGIVNGRVIIHWFDSEQSVNSKIYLEMLKNVVWSKIHFYVGRHKLFFQQDGARIHTTPDVRDWLTDKFQGRVIRNLMVIPWPARSPDLSPLDYWFWMWLLLRSENVHPLTLLI